VGGYSVDVSIIIVNFNSGAYLSGCLDSLMAQRPAGLDVEYLVVDSASTLDQKPFLGEARRRGARLVEMEQNRGYAGGCNHGLGASEGRFVFFLNADILALDGCIGRLVDYLAGHPDAGVIEPRTFLDPACVFIIPEIRDLNRWELLLHGCARLSGRLARRMSLRRTRNTLPWWRASRPIAVKTLTGAFLCARREVLDRVGGFDEGFSLFYEDTDLFRRIRNAGLRIVLVPEARAVHFAHRSIATVWEEAHRKMRAGRARYIRKHLGPLTACCTAALARAGGLSSRLLTRSEPGRAIDLGAPDAPPELSWEGSRGPYLLEIALDPHFTLAAGHLGEGTGFSFPPETWASLLPAEYFLRALEPERLEEMGCWRIRKTGNGST
jgi:GT2 family glycosyltransferase